MSCQHMVSHVLRSRMLASTSITSLFIRNCTSHSLKTLYPNTESAKRSIPVQPSKPTDSHFNGYIPIEKLEISYSRSSGPGGQHVNKVDTKAEVRFRLSSADWIPDKIRDRFFEKYANRVSSDGFFIIRSERTRSAQLNLADCLDKLRSSIRACAEEVKPPEPKSEEDIQLQKIRQDRATRERLRMKRDRSSTLREREPNSQ